MPTKLTLFSLLTLVVLLAGTVTAEPSLEPSRTYPRQIPDPADGLGSVSDLSNAPNTIGAQGVENDLTEGTPVTSVTNTNALDNIPGTSTDDFDSIPGGSVLENTQSLNPEDIPLSNNLAMSDLASPMSNAMRLALGLTPARPRFRDYKPYRGSLPRPGHHSHPSPSSRPYKRYWGGHGHGKAHPSSRPSPRPSPRPRGGGGGSGGTIPCGTVTGRIRVDGQGTQSYILRKSNDFGEYGTTDSFNDALLVSFDACDGTPFSIQTLVSNHYAYTALSSLSLCRTELWITPTSAGS